MRFSALCLWFAAVASVASAKVGTIDLKQLTKQSGLIVVGRVTSVSAGEIRMAEFQVEKTIKGHAPKRLQFVAEPTWRCDISDAKPGERLLLFLNPVKAGTVIGKLMGKGKRVHQHAYLISDSGRGRIALLGSGSEERIEFKPDSWMEPTEYVVNLLLPKDLPYQRRGGVTLLPAPALLAKVRSYAVA